MVLTIGSYSRIWLALPSTPIVFGTRSSDEPIIIEAPFCSQLVELDVPRSKQVILTAHDSSTSVRVYWPEASGSYARPAA